MYICIYYVYICTYLLDGRTQKYFEWLITSLNCKIHTSINKDLRNINIDITFMTNTA